jgi:hypothetical protein
MPFALKKTLFGKDTKKILQMQTGNFSFEILNLTFEGKNVKYFLKLNFSYIKTMVFIPLSI